MVKSIVHLTGQKSVLTVFSSESSAFFPRID